MQMDESVTALGAFHLAFAYLEMGVSAAFVCRALKARQRLPQPNL
jgi:hypothetical protein